MVDIVTSLIIAFTISFTLAILGVLYWENTPKDPPEDIEYITDNKEH